MCTIYPHLLAFLARNRYLAPIRAKIDITHCGSGWLPAIANPSVGGTTPSGAPPCRRRDEGGGFVSVRRGTPGILRSMRPQADLAAGRVQHARAGRHRRRREHHAPRRAQSAPARTGLTAETAAPSCWSIKQNYPASADGIYWLRTPKLVEPEQFYCDQTTDGGGWVLIGRGREGWSFQYWGQGSPSTVRSPITGPDGVRAGHALDPDRRRPDERRPHGRARPTASACGGPRTPTGTTWQEVRMRVKTYGKWSWAFGGGIYLSSVKFDDTTTNLGDVELPDQHHRERPGRERHAPGHHLPAVEPQPTGPASPSARNVTTGTNNATSYLWEFANENSAIPFTQVFIRPQITEADVVGAGRLVRARHRPRRRRRSGRCSTTARPRSRGA